MASSKSAGTGLSPTPPRDEINRPRPKPFALLEVSRIPQFTIGQDFQGADPVSCPVHVEPTGEGPIPCPRPGRPVQLKILLAYPARQTRPNRCALATGPPPPRARSSPQSVLILLQQTVNEVYVDPRSSATRSGFRSYPRFRLRAPHLATSFLRRQPSRSINLSTLPRWRSSTPSHAAGRHIALAPDVLRHRLVRSYGPGRGSRRHIVERVVSLARHRGSSLREPTA